MDAVTRRTVRSRCGDGCEYCRLPQTAAPFLTFHIEHIVATQHEGGDELDNLALACPDCNRHKGPNLTSIDPLTRQIVPLFHPRRDVWSDHFTIEGPAIHGHTATGRATARLLRFNDPERLAVRAALLEIDEWPPT
jgi:5-methylcytosine-specific restriction endonuclease McrA